MIGFLILLAACVPVGVAAGLLAVMLIRGLEVTDEG